MTSGMDGGAFRDHQVRRTLEVRRTCLPPFPSMELGGASLALNEFHRTGGGDGR